MVLIRTMMTPFEKKRLAAGLTQEQVATKLGVTQAAVKKWEKGLCKPEPARFPKLAKVLRITPEAAVDLFDTAAVPA